MAFFIYSNTFALIEFDNHETIFIFWQSKYILQKYCFDGGQKFMHIFYNEWSLVAWWYWILFCWLLQKIDKNLRYQFFFKIENRENIFILIFQSPTFDSVTSRGPIMLYVSNYYLRTDSANLLILFSVNGLQTRIRQKFLRKFVLIR